MLHHKISAYEGTENYIFISYAHKDAQQVFPIMEQLYLRGYRIWYDDGIAPGSEWPEDIARHLNNSAMVIAFVTPNSMASVNCRREINFALSKEKPFLSVVLEPTQMPLGMELQLSAQQSVIRYNYRDEETFLEKICACPGLIPCTDNIPRPDPIIPMGESAPRTEEDKPVETDHHRKQEETAGTKVARKTGKSPMLWGGAAVLVLIAAIAAFVLLGRNGGGNPEIKEPSKTSTVSSPEATASMQEGPISLSSFTVHIKAPHWGEQVILRGFEADDRQELLHTQLITWGDWCSTLIPPEVGSLVIGNQVNTEQTQPIPVEAKEAWILIHKDLSYEISYTGPVAETEQKTVTIHTKVPAGWDKAYCWAWSEDQDAFAAWPGKEMTRNGDWYCVEVPNWVTGIVVSDGAEAQSGDVVFTGGKPLWIVTKNNWWVGFYTEPTENDIREGFAGVG